LLGGNAGIALAALRMGDPDLAVSAASPHLRPAAAGVTWQYRPGVVARLHHILHGTLGIVYALASVDRSDFVEMALAGAALSRSPAPPTPRSPGPPPSARS
jgi:hypothetical protein